MRKIIYASAIALMALFTAISASAQNVSHKNGTTTIESRNFNIKDFQKIQEQRKNAEVKETTFTFTDAKGETHKVYESKNGAFFILRTSKKTGNEYRYYLPKEVQIAMGRKYDK